MVCELLSAVLNRAEGLPWPSKYGTARAMSVNSIQQEPGRCKVIKGKKASRKH
jgi:hypothetical protein